MYCFSPFLFSDSPGHLEEKVSQLEAMLKRLQDDLQKVLSLLLVSHVKCCPSPSLIILSTHLPILLSLNISTHPYLQYISTWSSPSPLRPHPHEARAFPFKSFFLSLRRLKNLRTHKTGKTNSKRCSVHAKSLCGAIILPQ